jgi:hypothetical protein
MSKSKRTPFEGSAIGISGPRGPTGPKIETYGGAKRNAKTFLGIPLSPFRIRGKRVGSKRKMHYILLFCLIYLHILVGTSHVSSEPPKLTKEYVDTLLGRMTSECKHEVEEALDTQRELSSQCKTELQNALSSISGLSVQDGVLAREAEELPKPPLFDAWQQLYHPEINSPSSKSPGADRSAKRAERKKEESSKSSSGGGGWAKSVVIGLALFLAFMRYFRSGKPSDKHDDDKKSDTNRQALGGGGSATNTSTSTSASAREKGGKGGASTPPKADDDAWMDALDSSAGKKSGKAGGGEGSKKMHKRH